MFNTYESLATKPLRVFHVRKKSLTQIRPHEKHALSITEPKNSYHDKLSLIFKR